MRRINTADNFSDNLTKSTPRSLFYRHMEYIQGKIILEYVKYQLKWKPLNSRSKIHYMRTQNWIIFFGTTFLFGHFPLFCNVLGYFVLELDKNVFDQFRSRNRNLVSKINFRFRNQILLIYRTFTFNHFILCKFQSIGGCSTEYICSNMRSNKRGSPNLSLLN